MQENLRENSAGQEREFADILERIQTQKFEPISWNAAYGRMVNDNLSLRQSKFQVEESKKQKARQWLTLVPRISTFVNVGAGISELSNLGSDDLNASLIANFNIPNPFQFYASLYAVSLYEQNAIWSHELDQRRAYTELYSLFIEHRAIEQGEAAQKQRLKSLLNNQAGDMDTLVKAVTLELQSLERRRLYHRLSVNRLLNTPGANWKLAGNLPEISYAKRYRRISVGEDFGKLALNLQAIQIEGAILRIQQVKFQQWPIINFGLSTPPLYTSNSQSSFSSDELRLFSGASKSFDLADIGGRKSLGDAKTRLGITREQLRLRAEEEGVRILQLRKSYEALSTENSYLRREIGRLERPGSLEPDIVLKDLERRSELEIRLIENRRDLQHLDLQFLIWDEKFWN